MKNRKRILLVVLAILLCSPLSVARQAVRKQTATAAPKVEPLRVLGGELNANGITGQLKRGGATFSFTLTNAQIVGGRLHITGDFAVVSSPKTGDQVTATVGGVMSTASNPWPNARQSSLPEMSTACGVLFLKLTLTQRLRTRIGAATEPLQLGVTLKPLDNQRGEEIVRQICLLQASGNSNQSEALKQLNSLFVSSK